MMMRSNPLAKRKKRSPSGKHKLQQQEQKTMETINQKGSRHDKGKLVVVTDLQQDSCNNINRAAGKRRQNHRSIFKWRTGTVRQQQEKNESCVSSKKLPQQKGFNIGTRHELMQSSNRDNSVLLNATKDSIIKSHTSKHSSTRICANRLSECDELDMGVTHLSPPRRKKILDKKDLIMNAPIGDKLTSMMIDTERENRNHIAQDLQEEQQQQPPAAGLGIVELNNKPSSSPPLHIQPDHKNDQSSTSTIGDTRARQDILGRTGQEHAHHKNGSFLSSLGQILAIDTHKNNSDTIVTKRINYYHGDNDRTEDTRKQDAQGSEGADIANFLVPMKHKLLDYLYCDNKKGYTLLGNLFSSDKEWLERFENQLLSFPKTIPRELVYLLCLEKLWTSSYNLVVVMKQGSRGFGAVDFFHTPLYHGMAANLSTRSSRGGAIISASSMNPAMLHGCTMKIPRGLMEIGGADEARVDLFRGDLSSYGDDDDDDDDLKVRTTCHQCFCHCLI